jgi:poly-gamma-glutamate capsule biosynthesis protein CapA/YwtB (metallophosphatase superfamily)
MRLLFSGDIAFNHTDLSTKGNSKNPLADILPLAHKADATILSFDSAIGPLPDEPWSKINISCPSDYISWLAGIPGLILNLANNHALDCGDQAFKDYQHLLSSMNIQIVGAGNCLQDAIQPKSVCSDGTSVAILSCATANCSPAQFAGEAVPGPAPFDFDRLSYQAQELRRTHDFVILCIHWGLEFLGLPLPDEYALGKRLLEDFDLVVGNHPHVVRGSIGRNERQLFFSLGNTLFGNIYTREGRESFRQAPLTKIGLLLNVDAVRGQPLRVTPISIAHDGLRVFHDDKARAIRELKRRSKHLNFRLDTYKQVYSFKELLFKLWGYRYDFRFRAYGLRDSLEYVLRRYRGVL